MRFSKNHLGRRSVVLNGQGLRVRAAYSKSLLGWKVSVTRPKVHATGGLATMTWKLPIEARDEVMRRAQELLASSIEKQQRERDERASGVRFKASRVSKDQFVAVEIERGLFRRLAEVAASSGLVPSEFVRSLLVQGCG